jgi:hypothetical protein
MEMRKLDSITFIGASWAGNFGTMGNSMRSCEQKGALMGGYIAYHTPV